MRATISRALSPCLADARASATNQRVASKPPGALLAATSPEATARSLTASPLANPYGVSSVVRTVAGGCSNVTVATLPLTESWRMLLKASRAKGAFDDRVERAVLSSHSMHGALRQVCWAGFLRSSRLSRLEQSVRFRRS